MSEGKGFQVKRLIEEGSVNEARKMIDDLTKQAVGENLNGNSSAWAREIELKAGQHLIIHGNTWRQIQHKPQTPHDVLQYSDIVVLHYAAPTCAVRIAELRNAQPYDLEEDPLTASASVTRMIPPVVLLSGSVDEHQRDLNNIVHASPLPSNSTGSRTSYPVWQFFSIHKRNRNSDILRSPVMPDISQVQVFSWSSGVVKKLPVSFGLYYAFFQGSTKGLAKIEIHTTLLTHSSPYDLHSHQDETLFYIFDGTVKARHLVKAPLLHHDTGETHNSSAAASPLFHRVVEEALVHAGELLYVPGSSLHSMSLAKGSVNSTYVCVNWISHRAFKAAEISLAAKKEDPSTVSNNTAPNNNTDSIWKDNSNDKNTNYEEKERTMLPWLIRRPERTDTFLSGRTNGLEVLRGRTNILKPDMQLPDHKDPYDTLLIIERGELLQKPQNKHLGRGDLVFIPAGISHGLLNIGSTDARVLTLEFHY